MKKILVAGLLCALVLAGCSKQNRGEDQSLLDAILNGPREANMEIEPDAIVPSSNGPGDQLPTPDDFGDDS